jgi:hypothetical protein
MSDFYGPADSTRRVFLWLLPRAAETVGVAGAVFAPTFLSGLTVTGGPKREAHFCSKRL